MWPRTTLWRPEIVTRSLQPEAINPQPPPTHTLFFFFFGRSLLSTSAFCAQFCATVKLCTPLSPLSTNSYWPDSHVQLREKNLYEKVKDYKKQQFPGRSRIASLTQKSSFRFVSFTTDTSLFGAGLCSAVPQGWKDSLQHLFLSHLSQFRKRCDCIDGDMSVLWPISSSAQTCFWV